MQFLLNAMNANTAVISQGYAEGVVHSYNSGLKNQGLHASFERIASPLCKQPRAGAIIVRFSV